VVRKAPLSEVQQGLTIAELVNDTVPWSASDVIGVGRPRAFHHIKKRYAPRVPAGAAIGDAQQQTLGTLGAWLEGDTDTYLLSCWHCIDGGQGRLGVSNIKQPAGGNAIATLSASVHPELDWKPGAVTIDASAAQIAANWEFADFVLQVGEIRDVKTVSSTDIPVQKSGASSHRTTGRLRSVGVSIKLDLPPSTSISQNPWLYERQLVVTPDQAGNFSQAGDSGAIVLDDDHHALGLLVGGGHESVAQTPITVATPIQDVLDALRRKLGAKQLRLRQYA
jgi:hypothetical protein